MTMDWNRILQLPCESLAGDKRVPKTQITSQANLTRAQQALLDKVAPVSLFAVLNKSNSHLLGVSDADYEVASVIFLRCSAGAAKGIGEAAHMLHGCFPNPTVILAESARGGRVSISVAMRRRSRAEHGAFVTECVNSTGLFDPADERYVPFLAGISFPVLPQGDMLVYLRALSDCCMRAHYAETLGFYPSYPPSNREEFMALARRLDDLHRLISELEAARKDKSIALGDSSKMRVRLRDERRKAEDTARRISALCAR